jgi:uncharacterized protein YaiI (UPF0178 family)
MIEIFIDADGCPVKEEVYKVAARYSLNVILVANKSMQIPFNSKIKMVVVSGGFDAADDYIAENIKAGDIAITADIPLAARCIKKFAAVIGTKGVEFTEENIGDTLATRELMTRLREMGEVGGGPPPMQKKDRSQFLSKLDQVIRRLQLKEQHPNTRQV